MLEQSCPDGEIGRRSGLKIRRPQGRGGSSPPLGTNLINHLSNFYVLWSELQIGLVPLLVPLFSVLLPSAREVNPMPRRTPKKERGVFERIPDSGIGGSDTKSKALSIARKWAVEATPSNCMQFVRPTSCVSGDVRSRLSSDSNLLALLNRWGPCNDRAWPAV